MSEPEHRFSATEHIAKWTRDNPEAARGPIAWPIQRDTKPERHTVSLPHPARLGQTTGGCGCGWETTYSYGHHAEALAEADQHIELTTGSEAIHEQDSTGHIVVLEGFSL